MNSEFRIILQSVLLVLAFASVSQARADDALDELRRCAKIPPVESRIACYEALGARVLREERISISEAASSASAKGTESATAAASSATQSVAAAEANASTAVEPGAEVATVATESSAIPETTSAGLPDDFGGARFEKNANVIPESARARVTSCPQSGDKKWNFIFEDGQIWKQSNSDDLKLRNCDFMATISEDTWGYKLKIDGKKRAIRVHRTR